MQEIIILNSLFTHCTNYGLKLENLEFFNISANIVQGIIPYSPPYLHEVDPYYDDFMTDEGEMNDVYYPEEDYYYQAIAFDIRNIYHNRGSFT